MLLHRIIVDMVAAAAGEMVVEVETLGEPQYVVALGMLEMAREELTRRVEEEE